MYGMRRKKILADPASEVYEKLLTMVIMGSVRETYTIPELAQGV